MAGVLEKASMAYGGGEVVYGDGSEGPHELGYLMLDSTRARQTLGYRPVWDLDETVTRTMAWYRGLAAGQRRRQTLPRRHRRLRGAACDLP